MKASTLLLGASLWFAAVALATAEDDALNPTDVGEEHLGKEVAVEGRIYSTGKSPSGIHLYFGADTTTAFQAVVLASHMHEFKVDVVKKYNRRNVRVTGEVEVQDGKYYIRIRDPRQIKVVPRRRSTS